MAMTAGASAGLAKNESDYYNRLDQAGKKQYKQKLDLLEQNKDPYLLSRDDRALWPFIKFLDICVYLINLPSLYTKESLKVYKSSEVWA